MPTGSLLSYGNSLLESARVEWVHALRSEHKEIRNPLNREVDQEIYASSDLPECEYMALLYI